MNQRQVKILRNPAFRSTHSQGLVFYRDHPRGELDMHFCQEFTCGCILHPVAGYIRRCAGQTSRTMKGRMVPKPDNAEKKHNDSYDKPTVRQYQVAGILP